VARHAEELGLALPVSPGVLEDSRGVRKGEHEGHFRFTVGQRRGIGLAAAERLYVIAIDPAANRVVVGAARELDAREADVADLRFLSGSRDAPFRAQVRVRHRAKETAATVFPRGDGSARVCFDVPVRAIAPGQSCVFYDGDVVIGGGVLKKSAVDSRQSTVESPT
jgi:tRNA-specific 2-thiouridylase